VIRETTWDRHRPVDGKARVWRRDDGYEGEFPWFYAFSPGVKNDSGCGSIARTWADAMRAVNDAYIERWFAGRKR
jgi:hypothetical protein